MVIYSSRVSSGTPRIPIFKISVCFARLELGRTQRPGPKYDDFSVRCICLANFFYFQTLFTEFENLSPLAQNLTRRLGRCC